MSDDASHPASEEDSTDNPPAAFDYEIVRLIGQGADGEVYLARDTTGAYRAVKVVFRESFDHDRPFEREFENVLKFQIISKLYHNQVQILCVGRREKPRQFYYVMELADDQERGPAIDPETYVPKTLRTELKRRGRLPAPECLSIGIALARALESLHENGLIHRDVKPANIIFVQGRPKLSDLAMVSHAAVSLPHAGTEGFIPPEGPGSTRADIFSLGKSLYEMCSGNDRMDFPELPADLDKLPDRDALLKLIAIIKRACDRDPRRRYAGARELCNDLLRVQRGGAVSGNALLRRVPTPARIALLLVFAGAIAFGIREFQRRTGSARTAAHPAAAEEEFVPVPGAKNLVVNGSFEKPGGGNASTASMAPWEKNGDLFEIWGDGRMAGNPAARTYSADGRQNLELLASTLDGPTWQTVPTTVGTRYAFSFYHTPRPNVVSVLTVAVNSKVVATFNENGTQLHAFNWQKFTTNFVATSNRTTLTFSDRSPSGYGAGAHIDGVSLVPIKKAR